MKTFGVRVCMAALSLVNLGLFVSESQAAGPAATQQAVTQIQSRLSEASVSGWRHWGCRGCGYRYGYGGYGYGGYGYGGWGGYRSYGYGYAYPSYGYYGGYSYARPVIYSSPSYSYSSPVYYSGYNYSSPYQSACGCGNSYAVNTPVSYSVSSYAYPAQPSAYGTVNSVQPYYGTTSPTPISSPTPIAPSTATPTSLTPAPYPAPPAEYGQPSASRAPIAVLPVQTAQAPVPAVINTPVYSPTFAYTGTSQHAAYAPVTYQYSPGNVSNNTLVSYRSAW